MVEPVSLREENKMKMDREMKITFPFPPHRLSSKGSSFIVEPPPSTVELDHRSFLAVERVASSEQKAFGELRKRETEGETILKQQTERKLRLEIFSVPHDIQALT